MREFLELKNLNSEGKYSVHSKIVKILIMRKNFYNNFSNFEGKFLELTQKARRTQGTQVVKIFNPFASFVFILVKLLSSC